MKTKLRNHFFTWDPDVPQDMKNRRYCVCGLVEDHPKHDVPPAPQQAAHRKRVGDTDQ